MTGIHPILTGELLLHLDQMGHSDTVVIVDAHFPAHRLGQRVIDLPALGVPDVVAAIRTVLPLDVTATEGRNAVDLMATADGSVLDVQREILAAAGIQPSEANFVGRYEYYDVAEQAYLIVRTGETRIYANALLRKGIVEWIGRADS
nr:RbsD/FucU domain-containing protein [Lysinibacter cavernae]